jgi:hypothetical protein
MISDPKTNKPLLAQGECRGPMLSAIGQRLRDHFANEAAAPMPAQLEGLLQKLAEVSRERKDARD